MLRYEVLPEIYHILIIHTQLIRDEGSPRLRRVK